MYSKIFRQIYESSIAENPLLRFTFMDLLVLANKDGIVDMTHESIARITNRPLLEIRQTIALLEGPDPKSRTVEEHGARIKRLDSHRDWGWVIVNYDRFHEMALEEERRKTTRDRVRRYRSKSRNEPISEEIPSCNAPVTPCNAHVTPVYVYGSVSVPVPEGGTGGNSRFQKPGLETIKLFCSKSGISPADAEWFWNKMEGCGWKNGGKAVVSWERTLTAWKLAGYLASQRQSGNGQPNPAQKQTAASRMTDGLMKELGLQ